MYSAKSESEGEREKITCEGKGKTIVTVCSMLRVAIRRAKISSRILTPGILKPAMTSVLDAAIAVVDYDGPDAG